MAERHSAGSAAAAARGKQCPLEEKTFERVNPISGVTETVASLVSTDQSHTPCMYVCMYVSALYYRKQFGLLR